jgi:hypothetical protein
VLGTKYEGCRATVHRADKWLPLAAASGAALRHRSLARWHALHLLRFTRRGLYVYTPGLYHDFWWQLFIDAVWFIAENRHDCSVVDGKRPLKIVTKAFLGLIEVTLYVFDIGFSELMWIPWFLTLIEANNRVVSIFYAPMESRKGSKLWRYEMKVLLS